MLLGHSLTFFLLIFKARVVALAYKLCSWNTNNTSLSRPFFSNSCTAKFARQYFLRKLLGEQHKIEVIQAAFGSCKNISGKYFIFQKCYFPERKIFSCVWFHFKKCFGKYFMMFGCVLKNTIENTFSTCCSHFLDCQTNI